MWPLTDRARRSSVPHVLIAHMAAATFWRALNATTDTIFRVIIDIAVVLPLSTIAVAVSTAVDIKTACSPLDGQWGNC